MLLLFLAGLLQLAMVAMAQNLTVTTQDPRMQFKGNWTIQESGYYEFTTQMGASVSLTFPGAFCQLILHYLFD